MAESKPGSLPHFSSLDELVNFFDTHDLGEFLDEMSEVHFKQDLCNCHSERYKKGFLYSDDFLKDGIFLISKDSHSEESQP
ncbi:MAG: BrnA antitoxin family protein [Candidatus Eremiobacteraeota bacterium]|nr:BrnA antitoxin family protein [Candidatus Eremiobacteraeota bacterium]